MALSIGGVVGALAYGPLAPFVSRRTLMVVAVTVLGAAMVAMAFLPPLWAILALALLQGLVFGPVGPIANYAMQTRSPEHMRGRVTGVMTSTAYAAGPLGYLLAGPPPRQVGNPADVLRARDPGPDHRAGLLRAARTEGTRRQGARQLNPMTSLPQAIRISWSGSFTRVSAPSISNVERFSSS